MHEGQLREEHFKGSGEGYVNTPEGCGKHDYHDQ